MSAAHGSPAASHRRSAAALQTQRLGTSNSPLFPRRLEAGSALDQTIAQGSHRGTCRTHPTWPHFGKATWTPPDCC